MKIIIENSTWNNVGDGWYQTSLYGLFKQLYPEHQIFIGEGPIRRAFRIKNHSQLDNALNIMEYERADVHIFSGPMLSAIIRDYSETIKNIFAHKEAYAFVSVSGTGLTKERVQEIGNFLKKYPPLFMATRDEETYNNFKSYVNHAYNGICTAFLVDKTIPLETIELEKPYFISSFYTELEPTYTIKQNTSCSIENLDVKHNKTMFGLPHRLSRHFDHMKHHQSEIGGHLIVRTIQNLNTRFNHINFALPNSFISFNPVQYLKVVKSSEFTISDRVHACAVSLACGKPARFMFETPRAGIFDRMGFNYKSNSGIMYPNMEKIEEEMDLLCKEIRKCI